MRKTRFGLIVAVTGFVAPSLSAWQMADHVRMADILAPLPDPPAGKTRHLV